MTIYKSINDTDEQIIELPSKHFFSYQLVDNELVILRTNVPKLARMIQELARMIQAGKAYFLSGPGDSITVENTKIVFY